MAPQVSVILCSHNPRQDFLDQALGALRAQTLPADRWELLLIDNASASPIAGRFDLSWHPHARHVREEQLGLTPARLRGVAEAAAPLLVFVDDDNLLEPGYLETAVRLGDTRPELGAWGGQVLPRFESEPPAWTRPYWEYLAIREFENDRWSNLVHHYEAMPCGAGLCVRLTVARRYAQTLAADPVRRGMDRRGGSLISSGDLDLALTACDAGLGVGQFRDLRLTHLMPSSRLEEPYLLRLAYATAYSLVLLESFRGRRPPLKPWQRLRTTVLWVLGRFQDPVRRKFDAARRRGRIDAIRRVHRQSGAVVAHP